MEIICLLSYPHNLNHNFNQKIIHVVGKVHYIMDNSMLLFSLNKERNDDLNNVLACSYHEWHNIHISDSKALYVNHQYFELLKQLHNLFVTIYKLINESVYELNLALYYTKDHKYHLSISILLMDICCNLIKL